MPNEMFLFLLNTFHTIQVYKRTGVLFSVLFKDNLLTELHLFVFILAGMEYRLNENTLYI